MRNGAQFSLSREKPWVQAQAGTTSPECLLPLPSDGTTQNLIIAYIGFFIQNQKLSLVTHLPNKQKQAFTQVRASGHEIEAVFNWVISFLCQNRALSQIAADSDNYYFERPILCATACWKESDRRAETQMDHNFYFCIHS